ncbi:MAG: hypothetical protein H6745_07330 [Deltaproteobacteria bacterium]|nr:hypothetical protein [Deltaproteobacteria bacterium]
MIRCRRPRLAALAVALAMAAPGPAAWAAEPAPVGDDRAAFDALVEEARVARAAGDLERALAALERAYALSGSAAVLNNVAVTLADLGRYGDAAAAAASLAAHPDVPPGRKDQVDALAAELAGKAARGWLRVALDPGATAANGGRALSPDADAEVPPGVWSSTSWETPPPPASPWTRRPGAASRSTSAGPTSARTSARST